MTALPGGWEPQHEPVEVDVDLRDRDLAGYALASFIAIWVVGLSAGFAAAVAVGAVVLVGSAVICWGMP